MALEMEVQGRRREDGGIESVASRQGRQGRQSLGAPEWKGPPSRVLIFFFFFFCVHRQLTDVTSSSAHVRIGLRRGARAAN